MDRQKWLAIRDSGSMGQFLRSRERFIHVSKTAKQAVAQRESWWMFFGSRQTVPGITRRTTNG